MAEKSTKLSIVIRAVDNATARIKAINDRLDAVSKPVRDFKSALSDLREKSGLNGVIDGFKGVGSAISGVLAKIGMIGGVAGVAVAGLMHIVDGFDELGDKADTLGVGVDWLAQMREAAVRSSASVEQLDAGMQSFGVNLGLAREGTGKLTTFLKGASPALLKQLQATKSTEEAFDLLADAMVKLKDPAKQAAFAQKTLGDAALAPLLKRGSRGLKEIREQYEKTAGSMEPAVKASQEVSEAKKDLKVSIDGVKAALATGLAPAISEVIKKLAAWFTSHRGDIEKWAKDIGERLPGAIQAVVEWLGKAWDKVTGFVDSIGGLKTVAIALGAALLAGPVVALGSLIAGLGSAAIKAVELIKALRGVKDASDAAGGAGGDAPGKKAGKGKGKGLGMGVARMGMALLNPGDLLDDEERERFEGLGDKLARGDSFDSLFAPAAGPSFADAVIKAMNTRMRETEARITVDFANAPKGTRVSTDPQSTTDVDLSVGYQMGGAL